MTRDGSGPDLEALLEDVLSAPSVDPELLIRFERDPASLTAVEREAVEDWLRDPSHRDALGAVGGVRAALRQEGAAPRRATAAAPAPDRSRGRRALRAAAGALVLAAAAGLVLVLLPGGGDAPAPGPQTAQGPVVPEVPAPLPPEPAPQVPPGPAPGAVVPEPAPAPRPEVPPAPSEPPEAAPAPSPRPAEPPGSRPVLLALATPRYVSPGGPERQRVGTALRSGGDAAAPLAISPEHVGRSSRARPELFWSLSAPPPDGAEIWLTIAERERAEPLVDLRLETPARPGLQRAPLPDAARLRPGVEYVWTISLRPDLDRPALDVVSQGWVRHEPATPAQRARVDAADPGRRPALWAELGYFYDAFAGLHALAHAHPDDARPLAAQRELLQQVGIDPRSAGLSPP